MTIKLYCMGESGNAYKAALALELGGLEWEPVYVDFFGGETRTPEFRKINVMGMFEVAMVLLPDQFLFSMGTEMLSLLADPQGRSHLVGAGFQQARRFSWTRAARQLLKIYKALLDRTLT